MTMRLEMAAACWHLEIAADRNVRAPAVFLRRRNKLAQLINPHEASSSRGLFCYPRSVLIDMPPLLWDIGVTPRHRLQYMRAAALLLYALGLLAVWTATSVAQS